MILLTEFLIFASVLLLSVLIIRTRNRKRNDGRLYPPSLPRLPIFGSLPFIRDFNNLPEFLLKKTSELGPVFTLQVGRRFILVLNTLEAIEDAFVKHASSFSGREHFSLIGDLKRKGILYMDYHAEFRRYRKLTLSVMREFGFGSKSKSENLILTEVSQLVDHVKRLDGKEFDPKHMIMLSASNVPLNMLLGRRRSFEEGSSEERLSEIFSLIEEASERIDPALEFFPILRFLPYYRKMVADLKRLCAEVQDMIENEARAVLDDETSDCFVTRYVKKEGPGYDHEQLVFTLRDLLAASIETTSTTLLWIFVYLANNPQVTERIQKEIDAVVPRDRLPTSDDQRNLPFTEATIWEVLRIRNPVPFAIPHLTQDDTEVLGFFVPANTLVIPNLTSAHKHNWSDAEFFKPGRFLDKDMKLIDKHRVISFSLGRRSCPGETLARHQLFLFVCGLVQNFSFLPPEGMQTISDKISHRTVAGPFRYIIRMIPRQSG